MASCAGFPGLPHRHRAGGDRQWRRSAQAGPAGWLSLAALLVLLVGCSDTPYEIVPIHGKVTYEDGSLIPAESVVLWFHPQAEPLEPNVHARPGIAELDPEDGTFDLVSTSEHGDGVVVGRHKVTVRVDDESRTGAGSVPAIYADPFNTPLEITVSEPNQEFHLKIAKPGQAPVRKGR